MVSGEHLETANGYNGRGAATQGRCERSQREPSEAAVLSPSGGTSDTPHKDVIFAYTPTRRGPVMDGGSGEEIHDRLGIGISQRGKGTRCVLAVTFVDEGVPSRRRSCTH